MDQNFTELTGHVSPETAYLVADYPYGFSLRTEIRYWIETKKGHGQRTMSQTRNPKRAGAPWNKPKGSTYSAIRVLVLNHENGHVEHHAIGGYASKAEIEAFRARYPETCAEERNRRVLDVLIARVRAQAHVTYTVTSGSDASQPRQTLEEQAEIMRKLTILELNKMNGGKS